MLLISFVEWILRDSWVIVCLTLVCIVLQNYESSESKIKREFESYGPIKRVSYSEHFLAGSVRVCNKWFPLSSSLLNMLSFMIRSRQGYKISVLYKLASFLLYLKCHSTFELMCMPFLDRVICKAVKSFRISQMTEYASRIMSQTFILGVCLRCFWRTTWYSCFYFLVPSVNKYTILLLWYRGCRPMVYLVN